MNWLLRCLRRKQGATEIGSRWLKAKAKVAEHSQNPGLQWVKKGRYLKLLGHLASEIMFNVRPSVKQRRQRAMEETLMWTTVLHLYKYHYVSISPHTGDPVHNNNHSQCTPACEHISTHRCSCPRNKHSQCTPTREPISTHRCACAQ